MRNWPLDVLPQSAKRVRPRRVIAAALAGLGRRDEPGLPPEAVVRVDILPEEVLWLSIRPSPGWHGIAEEAAASYHVLIHPMSYCDRLRSDRDVLLYFLYTKVLELKGVEEAGEPGAGDPRAGIESLAEDQRLTLKRAADLRRHDLARTRGVAEPDGDGDDVVRRDRVERDPELLEDRPALRARRGESQEGLRATHISSTGHFRAQSAVTKE